MFSLFRFSPLFGLIYISFNGIYIMVFGGKGLDSEVWTDYIYKTLDWKNNPELAVGIAFGGIIGLLLLFCFFYGFAKLRDYFWKKLYLTEIKSEEISMQPLPLYCPSNCCSSKHDLSMHVT